MKRTHPGVLPFRFINRLWIPALVALMITASPPGIQAQHPLVLWSFEDTVSPEFVTPELLGSDVTLSTGSIGFQNSTDGGGLRIANSGSWTQGAFDPQGKYIEFSITPLSGYAVTLSAADFRFGRTSAGPEQIAIHYSFDAFDSTSIPVLSGFLITSTDANNLDAASVSSGLPVLATETITFRIWGYEAPSTGNLRFNDFELQGTVNLFEIVADLSTPGNLTLPAGQLLDWTFQNTGEYDQLTVGGLFTVPQDTGTLGLIISGLPGYDLSPGDFFTIVNAQDFSGSIDSFYIHTDHTAWSGGWQFSLQGNSVVLTAIPEPSTFALLAGAGVFLAVGFRRRRRSAPGLFIQDHK